MADISSHLSILVTHCNAAVSGCIVGVAENFSREQRTDIKGPKIEAEAMAIIHCGGIEG